MPKFSYETGNTGSKVLFILRINKPISYVWLNQYNKLHDHPGNN